MGILKVENLTFAYSQEKEILKNLDLEIAPGEALVVLGQNGCGKTTLLKLLAGALKPTSGQIFFQGKPLREKREDENGGEICYISQELNEPLLSASATVYDSIVAQLLNLGLEHSQREAEIKKILEMVLLWDQRYAPVAQLSYGERKRLTLARALALKPKILLLDEPAAGLDPRSWINIVKELKNLNNLGTTIVITTNDIDWVPLFAHKILVINQGQIILSGTPVEVFSQPQLLRQVNLRLPRIAHLFEILHKRDGWLYNSLPLTIGQAHKYLVNYRSHEGKLWRKGYTTGACAAAAAKAAVTVLVKNEFPQEVEIKTPLDTILKIPINSINQVQDKVTCSVIKDGGDDPDVTHGLEIQVTAQLVGKDIQILGGTGVGKVTKPGLAVAPGEPAINPVPRKMIREAVSSLLPPGQGVRLEVKVPEGEKVAKKTLNPQLGIVGGISILGTTGIVEPMSEEAFKSSLVPQISMAKAQNHKILIMTPGRMGQQKVKERWGLPEEMIIQMSNFVGYMLQQCQQHKISHLILYGHIGKLIKVAGGIFHTHSKIADGRREILAAHASIHGASPQLVEKILKANTIEEAVGIIKTEKMEFLFDLLASQVSAKASKFVEDKIKIGTILTALNGDILGMDSNAKALLEELRCGEIC